MTRRVFRALPVGQAPVNWQVTIGQGATPRAPGGLGALVPEPEPEPDPVITVGWASGTSGYGGASGALTSESTSGLTTTVLVASDGSNFGTVRFATIVGASTDDIVWHASYAGSGGGDSHPDIGAHYSSLVVNFLYDTLYFFGVYTFTPYIDGVAHSESLTLTVAEE